MDLPRSFARYVRADPWARCLARRRTQNDFQRGATRASAPRARTGGKDKRMPNQQFASCIEACNACAAACNECAVACLQEPDVKIMAAG
jgi:hypothetical protein